MESAAFALDGGFFVDVDAFVEEGGVGVGVVAVGHAGGGGGWEGEHEVHVVLVEEVARCTHAHEHGAAVAVV